MSKEELLSKLDANVGDYLNEDEQQKFLNLVSMYSDIFAGSTTDLGKTNVLKHCMNTGAAPPICQPVR